MDETLTQVEAPSNTPNAGDYTDYRDKDDAGLSRNAMQNQLPFLSAFAYKANHCGKIGEPDRQKETVRLNLFDAVLWLKKDEDAKRKTPPYPDVRLQS